MGPDSGEQFPTNGVHRSLAVPDPARLHSAHPLHDYLRERHRMLIFPLPSTDCPAFPQLFRITTPRLHSQSPLLSLTMEISIHGEPRRFRVHAQAAGGHRPHRRRLHQAEKSRSAELLRTLSLSRREDAILLRSRHAPVLSLLRMRRLRATSSASSRRSRTSPFPKPSAWSRRNSASLCRRPAIRLPAKPKKPACAGRFSMSTSAP